MCVLYVKVLLFMCMCVCVVINIHGINCHLKEEQIKTERKKGEGVEHVEHVSKYLRNMFYTVCVCVFSV